MWFSGNLSPMKFLQFRWVFLFKSIGLFWIFVGFLVLFLAIVYFLPAASLRDRWISIVGCFVRHFLVQYTLYSLSDFLHFVFRIFVNAAIPCSHDLQIIIFLLFLSPLHYDEVILTLVFSCSWLIAILIFVKCHFCIMVHFHSCEWETWVIKILFCWNGWFLFELIILLLLLLLLFFLVSY